MRELKQGDRVYTPQGWGHINSIYNHGPKVGIFWPVEFRSPFGGAERIVDFRASDISPETFYDYMTRPTGFGKTSWGSFFLIQAIAMGGIIAGVSTWDDKGWTAIVAVAVVEAVLVLGTYMNFKKNWV